MAQAVASFHDHSSTFFASPPGLDGSALGSPAVEVEREAADLQSVMDSVREAVLLDVESRVSEKTEELWNKGREIFKKMQQRHKDNASKLEQEVSRCNEKMQVLEAENVKLKLAIATLDSRFSTLGVARGSSGAGTGDEHALSASAPVFEPGTPMQHQTFFADTLVSSPVAETFPDYMQAGVMSMPEVPPFPFVGLSASLAPVGPQFTLEVVPGKAAPADPFSAPKLPLSLVDTLTPPTSPEGAVGPVACERPAVAGTTFGFTLRKADGMDLGLDVSHKDGESVLLIEGVMQGGAVDAWNRQCTGRASADRVVWPGDTIVGVNGAGTPREMLKEIREKQLLKLAVSRGTRLAASHMLAAASEAEASPDEQPVAMTSCTLRAEASVFVPSLSKGTPAPQGGDGLRADKEF